MRAATSAERRAARLIRLIGQLSGGEGANARMLADRLRVSPRTIHRDIRVLKASDLSLEFDVQRQMYYLRGERTPLTSRLSAQQMVTLALLLKWAGNDVRTVLGVDELWERIADCLPSSAQQVARLIWASVVVRGEGESLRNAEFSGPLGVFLDGLSEGKQVRVEFAEGFTWVGGTVICPYAIMHEGEWWMVGRSHVHRRVVAVPVSGVKSAEKLEAGSSIPPRFRRLQSGREMVGVERLGTPRRDKVRSAV